MLDESLLNATKKITPKYEDLILGAVDGKIKVKYKTWAWKEAYNVLKEEGIINRYELDVDGNGTVLLPLTDKGTDILKELNCV